MKSVFMKYKRLASVVLSVSVICCSMLPMFNIMSTAENQNWDGNAASAYAGGLGTESDPFKITNAGELARMVENKGENGKYFSIENDIVINDTSLKNWYTSGNLQNWYSKKFDRNEAFIGTIFGNGHTISGLYYKDTANTELSVGLIPIAGNTAIFDLTVDDAYLETAGQEDIAGVGAFIGYDYWASVTINHSAVGSNVIIKSNASKRLVAGGLIGVVPTNCGETKIYDSISAVQFQTGNLERCGGFIGDCWGSGKRGDMKIERCISAVENAPLVRNYWAWTDFSNTYEIVKGEGYNSVTVLEKDKMKGIAAMSNLSGLDFYLSFEAVENDYPKLKSNTDFTPSNGEGTSQTPYLITTGEELAYIVKTGGNGKYYKLGNDISLNDVSDSNWYEKGNPKNWYTSVWLTESEWAFSGVIDGDGHKVTGLYYNTEVAGADKNFGLFPTVTDKAKIKNLTVDKSYLNITFKDDKYGKIGIFAGKNIAESGLSISNCTAGSEVIIDIDGAAAWIPTGGFIGCSEKTFMIENSISSVKLPSKRQSVGSFIGDGWGPSMSVNSCISTADASTVGREDDSISNINVYAKKKKEVQTGITILTEEQMKGAAARESMPGLDFGENWQITDTGYPRPRILSPFTGYAGGKGTVEEPYEIENAVQLKYAIKNDKRGQCYKLINDIEVNDTSDRDWYKRDNNSLWFDNLSVSHFYGQIDGDGHKITGIYYKGTASGNNALYIALLPQLKGNTTVRNLEIDNSYIEMNTAPYKDSEGNLKYPEIYIAGFIGKTWGGNVKVSHCTLGENVIVTADHPGVRFGGFIGGGDASLTIDNSISSVNITSHKNMAYYGTFIGDTWTESINFSFNVSTGNAPFTTRNARIILGESNNYAVINKDDRLESYPEYADGEGYLFEGEGGLVIIVKDDDIKGENAKKILNKLDFVNEWHITDSYPKPLKMLFDEGVQGRPWSGRLATKFAGGSGTEEDPYIINTPEQLAMLITSCSTGDENVSKGKYYRLEADLYLNDVSAENWYKNDPREWFVSGGRGYDFAGTFDGGYHMVYGLYYNRVCTSNTMGGLFPRISEGSTIKRLGIGKSNLYLETSKYAVNTETYAAAVSGWSCVSRDYEAKDLVFPVISECFADTTVSIEAQYGGGLIAGAPLMVDLYDCCFLGSLVTNNETGRDGGLVGNSWYNNDRVALMKNCYVDSLTNNPVACGPTFVGTQYVKYENVYGTGLPASGVPLDMMSALFMRGDMAKNYLKGFDFNTVWMTVKDGTPVLRGFTKNGHDALSMSNTQEPKKISISFQTNDGNLLSTVQGYPEYDAELPIPTREGYVFKGWYVTQDLVVPFDGKFPYYDILLYAKWQPLGFIQDFESYPATDYDMSDDYLYFRIGAPEYNANYVRSGICSMRRLGNSTDEQDLLLFYEDTLTPGREYNMQLFVTSDTPDTAVDLSLVFNDWPDVNGGNSGTEKIASLNQLKKGEWTEVRTTFVAKSKWIALRTSGNASVFIDDVMVYATDASLAEVSNTAKKPSGQWIKEYKETQQQSSDSPDSGNRKKVIKRVVVKKKNVSGGFNTTVLIVSVSAGALVLLAVLSVVVIKKRRKNQKKIGKL